jgi:hypothetical protein
VRRWLAAEELHRVRKRRPQNLEPVAAAARRPWKVDHQRASAGARYAAGEEAVRRLRDRVGAKSLRNPRSNPFQNVTCRFGRHVTGSEPGASGREDDVGASGELADRRRDDSPLVRDDASLHLPAVGGEQLLEEVAAPILALAGRDAV